MPFFRSIPRSSQLPMAWRLPGNAVCLSTVSRGSSEIEKACFYPYRPRKLYQTINIPPWHYCHFGISYGDADTPSYAKMTKVPSGKFPNRNPIKHCFFIEETIAMTTMVIAVHHSCGSAVPSVQWQHGNYAIRKFLSSREFFEPHSLRPR